MSDLKTNIEQAISDFADIKQAISDKGVDMSGTVSTSEYAGKIRSISGGGSCMDLLYEGNTSVDNPADLSTIENYHAILVSICAGIKNDSGSHVGTNLWLVSDLMAFSSSVTTKRFDTQVYGSYTWCTFTSDKKLYSESNVYPYVTIYGIK